MQDCSSIRQHCRSFNSAGKLHKYFSQCRGHCAERREGRTSIYIVINKLDALNYIVARYPEMHFKEEHFQLVAHKVDYYYSFTNECLCNNLLLQGLMLLQLI